MTRKHDPRHGSGGSAELPSLSERQRRILEAVILAFIEGGEPVSSLWLAERAGLGLSSASVRSTLAQLEELGVIHQPHTSAGRVPTDLGYRLYVNHLLAERRPARPVPDVEARLRRAGTVEDVLQDASRELSRVSHHVGFVLAARGEASSFQHIDFVALDARRVLVVVIATGGEISHKVVEMDEALRPVDLQHAANYLNSEFSGRPLDEVREAILARLREEHTLIDALLSRALRLAQSGFEDLGTGDLLFVQGASSLLDLGALGIAGRPPVETLRTLFRMIEEKHRLVRLLTEYIEGPGLTIVIGSEHHVPDLQPFSLVASTYSDGRRTGTVGIIGPTRMRYSRAIAAVDSLSRTVSRVLGSVAGS
jgi:heat-inducible transcriptional repressor